MSIRESYFGGDEFLFDFLAVVKSLSTDFWTKILNTTPSCRKYITQQSSHPISLPESRLWENISFTVSLMTTMAGG